ncbi:hypothetical protein [uncultured Thiodictyon sp.]|uniref:hypothetical protein n=1 Tax=uncultured Thiodictyon sp. TaxID=1846217 RepID=UPI0025F12E39|nr:hypothetical protein [uncultured Thiodictyon sp.]
MAEARARETALTEEKKALALAAQRLRQDLRKVQSVLDDDERVAPLAKADFAVQVHFRPKPNRTDGIDHWPSALFR